MPSGSEAATGERGCADRLASASMIRDGSGGLAQWGTVSRSAIMPWFFFHLRSPKGLERDDLGLEFPSLEAAYLEAFRTVPGMSAELAFQKLDPTPYTFEITETGGRLLMEVPFTEVLDRGRQPAASPSAELFRKGRAAMERTAGLLKWLRRERAMLEAKLSETRRLLAASERAARRSRVARRR